MTWERALEVDARLAAKNAVLIRAALRQAIDPERIYAGYKNTTPDESLTLPQQRVRARAWAIMNVRVNLEPLKEVIYRLWAQGYALGDTAAREAITEAKIAQKADTTGVVDWSKWKPGDAVAALLLKPPRAFQQLLQNQGITFKGFSDTTLTDIGNAVGEAIYLGLDAKKSAKLIGNHVANPARALSIAITEQNRAISQATVNRYRDAGLQQQEWLVFEPCNICAQNANVKVNIGAPFPSGNTQPPAHPHCRCALAPVIPGFDDPANTAGITTTPSMTPEGALISEPIEDYRMRHQAPTRADEFGSPATDIGTEMMPGFYENPRRFTSGMDIADKESTAVLLRIRNKPEEIVTIYRAVPDGVDKINPGDWVTLSPAYAEQHLASNIANGRVISMQIPAKDLWFDGNSINEFGYDPISSPAKGMPYQLVKTTKEPVAWKDTFNVFDKQSKAKEMFKKDFTPRFKEVAKNQIKIAIDPMNLEKVINDGRFKNIYEIQSSRAAQLSAAWQREYFKSRTQYETEIFGIPEEALPYQKPIYGYLDTSDSLVNNVREMGYGSADIVLKESVRSRVTMSAGDSLQHTKPVLVTDVLNDKVTTKQLEMATHRDVLAGYVKEATGALTEEQLKDYLTANPTYWEAEIHGGVTLDDIEKVILREADYSKLSENALAKLKKAGIKVEVRK